MQREPVEEVIEEEVPVWLSEPQEAVLSTRQQLILEMSGQGGGKSQNIGYSSGMLISQFPEGVGFIGANTHTQLSQSTLNRVFKTWKKAYDFEEYEAKGCPWGSFVIDKKPPPHFVRLHKLRNYDSTISFWNGCLVFIGSLENYKAHDGKELAWAHLDETKDTKEKALKDVILGRLRQYGLWYDETGDLHWDTTTTAADAEAQGWKSWNPLYIHTSPAIDGAEWLLKMFKLEKFEKEIKKKCQAREKDFFYKEFENKAVCIYSAYHNAENMAPDFLKNQEENLNDDPAAILKLVDGYPFGQSGGAWFPYFRRDKHVRKVQYIPGQSVSQTWDFNVTPYMTCLLFQIKYLTRYIDAVGNKYDAPQPGYHALDVTRISFYKEYCFESPLNSIASICDQFSAEHDPQITEIYYYGDKNGLHRVPGLGSYTNFKEIEERLYLFVHNDSKKVKDPNVAPLKRRDLCNDIMRGEKYPHIEIEFDEDMEKTIEDCENVKQGSAGKIKPKVKDANGNPYEKYGHPTDAIEYAVSEVLKFLLGQG